jgi:hypothetical protein
MLTHQQTAILESAWEILNTLRNCRGFNESHDLTVGDGCTVLGEFLDWHYEKEREHNRQHSISSVQITAFEAFNNL